jgi:4-hydroxyphenylpyruvate dioxygenase-like putative hemolysin
VLGRVERAESDEPTLEDVPEKYWEMIRDRTGFVEQDVEDIEQVEELLSDRQYERLVNRIE